MIHLKFFLGVFFFSLSITLLKRKEKNTSTDRVRQYFLAFEDEVALGPEIFHVRFPFSEVFSTLNSFMLFALCEIYHAFAVVYKKKLSTQFFEVVFRPLIFAWFTGNSSACQTRTLCVNSLTSGLLRSTRDDFIQILITTSLMLQ